MNRLKEGQDNGILEAKQSDELTAPDTLGLISCPLRRGSVAGNKWKKQLVVVKLSKVFKNMTNVLLL